MNIPNFGRGLRFAVASVAFLASMQVLADLPVVFDETTMGMQSVIFQRGVFRANPKEGTFDYLCIRVQGKWQQIGTHADCGAKPPEGMQQEATPFPTDITFLGIRNLGLSTEEWQRPPGTEPSDLFRRVHNAFSYNVDANSVNWSFDSSRLPNELKADIPGAAIHVHFGGRFSDNRAIPVLAKGQDGLAVEVGLAVPYFVSTGKAYAGLAIGVDLKAVTVRGDSVGVPVLVKIFGSAPKKREGVMTDFRVFFVSPMFRDDSRYIKVISGAPRNSAWGNIEKFAFKLTRQNLQNIVDDINAKRASNGDPLIDDSKLDAITVTGLTLRNENRFLMKGDIAIKVKADYLKMYRAADVR